MRRSRLKIILLYLRHVLRFTQNLGLTLSLCIHCINDYKGRWSEWGDSNSRRLEPKSSALPTGPHPDIRRALYTIWRKKATGKCVFTDLRQRCTIASASLSRLFTPLLQLEKREILRSRCRRKPAYGCGIPLAGIYRIPPLLEPSSGKKSLAHSSCRLNPSSPRIALTGFSKWSILNLTAGRRGGLHEKRKIDRN